MATYTFVMFTGELWVKKNQFNPLVTAEGPVVTTIQIPLDSKITSATLTVNLMAPTEYRNEAELDVYFNGRPAVMDMAGDKSATVNVDVTEYFTNGYNAVHLEWLRNGWASGLFDQMCKVRIDLEVETAAEPMDVVRGGEEFMNDLQAVVSGEMDQMAFLQKYQWQFAGGVAVLIALIYWQSRRKRRKR